MSIKYSDYNKYVVDSNGIDKTYNMPIIIHSVSFDSLADFIASLKNFCENNKEYFEESFIINDTYKQDSFFGGSFDDALNVNNKNLPLDINDFSKLAEDVAEKLKDSFSYPDYYKDVNGLCFDVAEVLTGRPECWFNVDSQKQKRLDIFYNLAIDWRKSTKQIYNRGAVLLGLLDALKAAGVAMDLHLFFRGRKYNKRQYNFEYCDLMLNLDIDVISPDTLRFITCNSLFIRRLVFCLEEILTHKKDLSKDKYLAMMSVSPENVDHDTLVFSRDFAPEDINDGIKTLKNILDSCDFNGKNVIKL